MFLVQRYYKLSFILGDGFCVPSKCNSDNACPSVGNIHSGMVKNTDFHFQRKHFFLLVSHLRLSQRKEKQSKKQAMITLQEIAFLNSLYGV